MINHRIIDKCLLCDAPVNLVFPLTPTPPANALLLEPAEQETFPLNLMQCKHCKHLQIDTSVDRESLFRHYLYLSNTSKSNCDYFASYAKTLIERFAPKRVVDIASNDGLFLSYFKDRNIDVLGIDPALNIAKQANEAGITTIPDFFNELNAKQIVSDYGKADLITCNNMFAHNDDLGEIIKGVKHLLSEQGTFVFEVSYAVSMLKNNLFDLIYHEHIHHHHITPLLNLFEKYSMRIYDANEVFQTHGGSIRIFVCHQNSKYRATEQLLVQLEYEKQSFDHFLSSFVGGVQEIKNQLTTTLTKLKQQGKTISILGYPAKATTMIYYLGLDQSLITDIFDDNALKINRYSPGKNFKILSTSDIYERKPDCLLILAWNYAEALMKTHYKFMDGGGTFVIPLPRVKLVGA